ncbi:GDSL-type esterase/lipase family protein [Knoellia koreensis]|uniref:SGNH/GDSL hydrolase family protein n=1 Tax=Knoellia koreensis TaxID=2730921 RepID=A0A849H6L4_9MICO|nr:SGNH/GDSL hydrolase family protein [Knoellia sp. DB2414S]
MPRRWPTRLACGLAAATLLTGCSARPPGTTSGADTSTRTPTTTTAGSSPSASSTTRAVGPTTVVGLGDSVMSGMNCDCDPFIVTYAAALGGRDHRTVHAVNLGQSGITTPQLIEQLHQPDVAARVAAAGEVVITIGANDLVPLVSRWKDSGCAVSCMAPSVATMGATVDQALARVGQLVRPGTPVLVTDYWNVFEDGDVADVRHGDGFADWSDAVTLRANAAICAAAMRAGDTCVDLRQPFLGDDGSKNPTPLLADDGDHPDAAGHALIARTLLAATP